MKRKSITAIALVALMTAMTVLPVFAREVSEDTNITGWEEDNVNCTTDVTLTVDEGGEANVGSITAGDYTEGFHDVTISGGGTLNVNSSDSPAISGGDISFEGVTVNASSNTNVIESHGEVSIEGSTVSLNGTGEFSGGIRAESGVDISGSDVNISVTGGHAIFTMNGDISVNDSNLDASSKVGAIFAESGTINIGDSLSITTPEGGHVATPPYGQGGAIYDSNGPKSDYDTGASKVVIKKAGSDNPKEDKSKEDKSSSSGESTTTNTIKTEVTTPVSVIVASVDPVTMGEAAYTSKVTSMIAEAPYGGTIEINVTSGAYLNDLIISALETRSDVSLKINVVVDGVPYVLNIPAGFNLRALLGADGKIDLQKLIAAFGTAK